MSWSLTRGESVDVVSRFAALYEMSRPRQLSIMGALYGLGVAAGHVARTGFPLQAVAAGAVVLLVAGASINYVNEYADYESDRCARRTAFSGGSGALVDRDLPADLGLHAAVATLAVCTGLTVLFLAWGLLSPAAGAAVAAFLLLGWQYSVWPAALAWRGLGELDNAVAGGVVLPVFGVAVVTGGVGFDHVAAFLPTTAFLFLTLLATTWPDRRPDARAGKATLATRLSGGHLRVLYAACLVAGAVLTAILPSAVLPDPVRIGAAASLVGFGYGLSRYTRRRSPTPTVLAMTTAVGLQTLGWLVV